MDAPFGYKPNGYATYLSGAVDYGYYKGLENANTPAAVERKIDELARHPERDLLIPAPSAGLCAADVRLERALMHGALFFAISGAGGASEERSRAVVPIHCGPLPAGARGGAGE